MTDFDNDKRSSVSSALAAAVAARPDAHAIIDASGRLSFADFENWTNDLANRILERVGSQPNVCLVVAGFDREAIVAMVASLKTPHAFVALDREVPPANVAEIATQLGAGLIVHTEVTEAQVEAVDLSIPKVAVGPRPAGAVVGPAPLTDLERVATFKRSSGSTGGAKTAAYSAEGVLLDADLGAWANEITPGAAYGLISTFDSAMSSTAIMRCLLAGGTLMPVDLRFEPPKRAVARLIGDGLTHIHATPTAFRLLTQGLGEGEIFPEVHSVFLSGEKSTMADVRLIAKTAKPTCKMRAAFASSETQLVAHTTVVPSKEPGQDEFARLSVFPGVRVDILDEDGKLKPAGELGRLQVTSKMVSLGYRGKVDPAIVARFTANEDGSRSYLTDDMAIVTEDGQLVLKSRAGREVKIRGRRVDLGEVETWLTSQADIAEAAVVVQPLGHDGSDRLAAFIKADAGFESTAALRERMKAELIASLHPSAIVVLEHFPRTANQKIDRRALEADLSHLDHAEGEALDAEGLLGQVAQIWAEVLKRQITGQDQDFFDLGGDSIAATVAAIQIEEVLGIAVDTGFVHRHPKLAEQTRALEEMKDGGGVLPDRLLVPLTAGSLERIETPGAQADLSTRVFLIPGAYGFVLPFAPLAEAIQPSWDLIGVLQPDHLKNEPALQSVEAFAERMFEAIQALQPHGPYVVMGYSFGGAVAHEIVCLMEKAGEPAVNIIVDTRVPRLLSPLGRINQARRDVTRWVKRKLGKARPQVDAGNHDQVDGSLAAIEHGRLPIYFDHGMEMLANYRPARTTVPTALIKAPELRSRFDAEDFGWGRIVPLAKVVTTQGNHDDMFKGENLESFAQAMDDCLVDLMSQIGIGKPDS